jgi:hypothetical protein
VFIGSKKVKSTSETGILEIPMCFERARREKAHRKPEF